MVADTYGYAYDGLGRLTDAAYYAGAATTQSLLKTEKNISYDRNGNITALTRYDEAGTGTPLSFTFTGNRIAADTHDAMGNLTRNSRNGLEFSYNLANLPENVEGTGGASLTYQYLSDGSKWRASANDGPSILYRGSFVYEDDGESTPRISSIAWDEGRISYHYAPAIDSLAVVDSLVVEFGEIVVVDTMAVDIVEDGICDEWHVRDHLGSVRAIAGIGNYITGIRELNSYLPFGTRIPGSIQAADNRHRFGGKEEQRYGIDAATGTPAIDLGLLDFGARYYDPFTCRWTTRDPLAGKYLSLSPYNYCSGNPVNMVDPDGTDDYQFDKQGYYQVIVNDDPYDRLVFNDGSTLIVKDKTIMSNMEEHPFILDKGDDGQESCLLHFSISNAPSEEMIGVFSALSEHTNVEWGVYTNTDGFSLLGTQHRDKGIDENALFHYSNKIGISFNNLRSKIHNHTPGYSTEVDSMTADIANMSLTPNLDSYVYFPQSKNIYKITSDKVIKLNSFPRL